MEIENSKNNLTNFNPSSSGFFKKSSWKFQTLNDLKSTGKSYSLVDNLVNNTLKFSNQYLRTDDWEYIANTFSINKNFNSIELSGISINGIGLKKLGEIIVDNANLINVKLQWNYLNEYPEEFDYFCNCLGNSHVKSVNLSNNRINSYLCNSISKIILISQRVQSIDLSWNELNVEGARILIDSLKVNSSLQYFNLSGNKISEDYLEEISEYINRNSCHNLSKCNSNEANFTQHSHKINTKTSWINKSSYQEGVKVENVPLKFLEKEKEISDEYKARYDVQLIINAKLEKKIKESETLIELERNKVDEAKKDFEIEKDKERNLRCKYEEQVGNLKGELLKKTVELENKENIYKLKISQFETKILNLEKENKSLKENLKRIEDKNEEKVKLTKEENENNYSHLNSTVDSLRIENEKIRREFYEENKRNLEEFEQKIRSLEQINFKLKLQKDEAEKLNIELRKRILDLQIETGEKLREKEIEIVQLEKLQSDSLIDCLEKKINNLEYSKEELVASNNSLLQEITNLKKLFQEERKEKDNELNSVRIEKNNLNKSHVSLSSELNKLNLDLKSKDAVINKLKLQINDKKNEMEENKTKLEEKVNNLEGKILNEKYLWENRKNGYESKISELEKTIENLKNKIVRIENDEVKFSELMKKEISRHIDENS